ncbi:hypothetical protein SGPA1_31128 [Streptomyces misionensis JCM 4497]
MGLALPGRAPAQPGRLLHAVPADRRLRLRGVHHVPGDHDAAPQARRVDPQPGAQRRLPRAVRVRHGVPGDPPVRAELGLAGADGRVRRGAARGAAGVLCQGRPRQPPARGHGRRLRRGTRLPAGRAAGDGHQRGARRGPFDLPGTLALRRPAAGLGLRRRTPLPRHRPAQLGQCRDQRAQYGPGARRLLRRLPLPAGRGPAHRGRRETAAGAAGAARRAGLAGLLRAAPGEERGVVADRQGGRRLPGRRRGEPRLRGSAGRSGGLARGDRAVAREGAGARLDPGGDGGRRGGGHRVRPARPGRAGARGRGDRGGRRLHPGGAGDAHRAAGLQPGEARGVRGARPAPRGHPGARDGAARRARGRLAGRRDRARVQHGARPARGPRGRALRDAGVHGRAGPAAGAAVVRALGTERAVAGPDAPRPGRRERADGVHGHRTAAALRGDRGHTGLAELRDVPLGLRTGGTAGRRTGAQAVAVAAQLLLPLVADRVAVPRQRQVPAHLGAAVPALREERGPAAHRPRLGPRGGLPGGAGAAQVAAPQAAGRPSMTVPG